MRKYTSERIDRVIDDISDDSWIFKHIRRHKELVKLWQTIPDNVIRRLEIAPEIDTNNHLIIACKSSVALHHIRKQRLLIEKHLEQFTKYWEITDIIYKI